MVIATKKQRWRSSSSQHTGNDTRGLNAGETHVQPLELDAESLVVDAEQVTVDQTLPALGARWMLQSVLWIPDGASRSFQKTKARVPPGSIAAGNPVRIIRRRDERDDEVLPPVPDARHEAAPAVR